MHQTAAAAAKAQQDQGKVQGGPYIDAVGKLFLDRKKLFFPGGISRLFLSFFGEKW